MPLRAANRGASAAIDRYGRATPAVDALVTMTVRGTPDPAPAVHWAILDPGGRETA